MVLLGVLAQEAHAPLERAGSAAERRSGACGRPRRRRATGPLARALGRRAISTSASWSTEPAAAITMSAGRVARGVEGAQLLARHRPDHLGAADHRAPERVRAEDRLAEHVEDAVLGVVLVHRDLFEHDLALGLELAHARAPDHVGDHVEGALQVAVEHARVHRGRLLVGARVELGAHRVEDLVDLLRAVALGAAEQHVLEQVRDARLARRARAPSRRRSRSRARPSAPPGSGSLTTRTPESRVVMRWPTSS